MGHFNIETTAIYLPSNREDFKKAANTKFKQILEAYEKIKEHRGFKWSCLSFAIYAMVAIRKRKLVSDNKIAVIDLNKNKSMLRIIYRIILICFVASLSLGNFAYSSSPIQIERHSHGVAAKVFLAQRADAPPRTDIGEVIMTIACVIGMTGGCLLFLGLIFLLTPIYPVGIFLMRLGILMFFGGFPIGFVGFLMDRYPRRYGRRRRRR